MHDEIARFAPFPLVVVSRSHTIDEANEPFANWARRRADDLVGVGVAEVLGTSDETLAAALAGDNRDGIPLQLSGGGSVIIRATRISEARTIIALDPAWDVDRSPAGLTRSLGQRERDRLQLLLSASVAFANTQSERELGELLSETARRAFNASACSVHTGEAGNYTLVAGDNRLEAFWPDTSPQRGQLTVQLGRVVLIESPESGDAEMPGFGIGDTLRRAGVCSVLASPISDAEAPLGAFVLYFDQPRTFDGQAVPLAEALAQLAAQVFVRLRLEAQIRRAAMMDEVTGLPNRRLFEENMQQARATSSERAAVLFLDLDGFKSVNDTLGHAMGDTILQQVADRLRHVFRQEDSIARYGGDEFIAAFHVSDQTDAIELADRARAAIAAPFSVLPPELSLTASIGVAVAAEDHPIDGLIRLADQAMYVAKAQGGDQAIIQTA